MKALLREFVWLMGAIIAVGLALVADALAHEAPTALDVFAAFVAVIGGVAIYAVAGLCRLAWRAGISLRANR
jgi:hypothetical protein